tara:strand:- start:120 stop:761 length:642 start_codon:yes stop_codon:yes gene_type:complete
MHHILKNVEIILQDIRLIMYNFFSGSHKLYDLNIEWRAESIKDILSVTNKFEIYYGFTQSPFGNVLIMSTALGICGLAFTDKVGNARAMQDMTKRWPQAKFIHDENHATNLSAIVFDFSGKINLHIIGSPFQIKVWRELLQIKAGHVVSYSDVAAEIDQASSVRAVGTAIGCNPISFLIPCHRVIQKSGGIGGYHWGLAIKEYLLAFENKNSK